ncbi:3-hydroxyacyl-CoA dehydrogenase/enoyl-CoA hydratase family protein [uncultured Thiothrix sp.]|uniref:3-hydroxyacyl-CoA dehydrogenase/enoyl-CoA hydratase family protein n=1 Tax=uncultured Thiothrix sp. TaxID=223185 RepID=UPI0026120FD3|nr:3-hydroxyacyl-CoA dehydrogenase/enoyl-CoA hydratase family protein [uncultured Thiothrix sp.]
MEIRKVAVIGAGVMGAGIAAHIANAGVPVVLLDIVPQGATNRNVVAETAVEKLLKADPAAFMHKRNARLVTTGNIEDHMNLLADCDWIIEAIIERLDLKQNLYKKIDAVRRADAVVSSNTSTIPLHDLVAGLPASFAEQFMITHFFNPPRYMRLLEVASGAQTKAEVVQQVSQFCDLKLGKGVVGCKDSPGFIANRIGIYWIQTAILEAMNLGLTVEEADAVVGKPMGIPKTGVFGLSDLVGIDLMPHLMESLKRTLPAEDAFHAKAIIPPVISKMIQEGYTGRKGKGGFYRLNRAGSEKIKESINLQSGEYGKSREGRLESVANTRKLADLVSYKDKGGEYAWKVLAQVLSYAASLVPEIADDIHSVDTAMRLGYNWKYGPFELIDQLGAKAFAERLAAEGSAVPPLLKLAAEVGSFYRVQDGKLQYLATTGQYQAIQRPAGVLLLEDIKRTSKPVAKNASASLWDIGDGVICLEFTSKMNAMDPQILAMIQQAIGIVSKDYKALVIYNEGSNFSVGANLGLLLFAANIASWDQIESMVKGGQDTYKAMKYAPFPIVGAPAGMALGGGCEVLLHCSALQAHAETYMGLVEVGVGVIPGWGGCKEMLQRWVTNKKRPGGLLPPVVKVFEMISTATVSKSAQEAQDYLFLRPSDAITMNRDRLLADAKAKALAMVEGYQVPEPIELNLPGATACTAMRMAVSDFRAMGKATPHDEVVSNELAYVLSGGSTDMVDKVSEDQLLQLERNAFMHLVRNNNTLARMETMLETGKPLRN